MPVTDQRIDENRYKVIPRTLVFIFDGHGRVLLLKGFQNKRLWAGLYNGIGGHIEVGEDILKAALREVREETGLKGIDLQLCGQIMVDVSAEMGVALFLFKGLTPQELPPLVESNEGELCWIHTNLLGEVNLVEDLRALLPRVINFQPGDRLIIGKSQYSKDGKLIISFV